MKFYSESLNRIFESVEDLQTAEAEAKKAEEEKKAKAELEAKKKAEAEATRKEEAKKVEQAFKDARDAQEKANKILADFCKKYGAFHTTFKGTNPFHNSLVDFMLDRF